MKSSTLLFISCTCIAFLTVSCSHSHAPRIEENAAPKPVSIKLDQEKNPYGSIFVAERVEDTCIEKVGQVATYRFVCRNFLPEQKLVLISRYLNGYTKPISEYDVDDDGLLGRSIQDSVMMLDNEQWLMFDYFRGEPVQYWLRSKDGSVSLMNQIIPYPIRAEGADGAEVNIRRLVADARLVICEGKDFLADEQIYISSQSAGKRTQKVPVICTNGRFSMIFEPAAEGKSGGTAYVEVQRFKERLILDYDWGCDAINPKRRMANTTNAPSDALLKLPTELD